MIFYLKDRTKLVMFCEDKIKCIYLITGSMGDSIKESKSTESLNSQSRGNINCQKIYFFNNKKYI